MFHEILSQKELMISNKNGLLHKLGLNGREVNFNNEQIRFFKPTANNIYSLGGRKGKAIKFQSFPSFFHSEFSFSLEKYFNDWNKILLDKDEKERMDNFAVISRDDLSRRKVADEMKIAADKQAKYESQLKKMGIPVIVGLVNYSIIFFWENLNHDFVRIDVN
jgi:hypothetical protein